MKAQNESVRWSLAIHGGAGSMRHETMPEADRGPYLSGLEAALAAGAAVLGADGSALDAVSAAVCMLEDDPHFNAGRGAVFTYHGTNELDAAIMDGATRKAGAVAGVGHTKNPVKLARAVMDHSPHVMLSGMGAEEFGRELGIEQVDPDWFATGERWRQLQELKAKKLGWFDVDLKYGTVGAVARDAAGHLAAATSTGGLTGKRWGRIGDSPLIGAGTYADDRSCAVSATGAGEAFICAGVAHEIGARIRLAGADLQAAADAVLADAQALGRDSGGGANGGGGGVILVGTDGRTAFAMTTPGMYRGRADSAGLYEVAIFGP